MIETISRLLDMPLKNDSESESNVAVKNDEVHENGMSNSEKDDEPKSISFIIQSYSKPIFTLKLIVSCYYFDLTRRCSHGERGQKQSSRR